MKTIFTIFHHSEIGLPIECVRDCTRRGANDESVDYWQRTCTAIKYPPRSAMIDGLADCGAWSREELEALNDGELEQKTLWVSCHNAKEEMGE